MTSTPSHDAGPSSAPVAGLRDYYETLLIAFGPQRWWPARTRLEVILGAILTQNTTWRNAALALAGLRKQGLLRLDALKSAPLASLEGAIRQAGFYRQKAAAILGVLALFYGGREGGMAAFFAQSGDKIRRDLLGVKGIGQETADAILLYAGRRPWFVADAYTRRILARHGWLAADSGYEAAQELLHRLLPRDWRMFNEFHALLVETGKRHCLRAEPRCAGCPLRPFLPAGGARSEIAAPSVLILNQSG